MANITEQHHSFYDAHVFVCTNRRPVGDRRGSCGNGGSEALRDYMKARTKELGLKRVRINGSACLDRCELGPCVVIYPDAVWYRIADREAADAVLEQHVRDRHIVEPLRISDDASS